MKALFVEMPVFEQCRSNYLTDEAFTQLQQVLLANPASGDVIKGTGGLRKVRWADAKRGKGKRGGTRIIYYYFEAGKQFWLFVIYDKGEMADLSDQDKKLFRSALRTEIKARQDNE